LVCKGNFRISIDIERSQSEILNFELLWDSLDGNLPGLRRSFKLPFFGACPGDKIAEITDSAASKTTETAKTAKAAAVKINIKNTEISFLIAAFM
jgi:hypothetical protein